MRFIFPFAVAAVLAMIAWPVLDTPEESALTFIAASSSTWTAPQTAWVGDDDKRNAILVSAVWRGPKRFMNGD